MKKNFVSFVTGALVLFAAVIGFSVSDVVSGAPTSTGDESVTNRI